MSSPTKVWPTDDDVSAAAAAATDSTPGVGLLNDAAFLNNTDDDDDAAAAMMVCHETLDDDDTGEARIAAAAGKAAVEAILVAHLFRAYDDLALHFSPEHGIFDGQAAKTAMRLLKERFTDELMHRRSACLHRKP